MLRFFFRSFCFVLVCLQFSCKGGLLGTSLPAKRPDKMIVELYEGGGMLPESTNYYISEDSCYVKFFKNQAANILRFKLSSASLDSLYAVFYENSFDKITAKNSETFDRGGVSVTLRYGDKNIDKEDAGSTYINEVWQKNFYAVVTAIINQANKVVKENTVPFVVKFDKRLLVDSLTFHFEVENFSYSSDSGHKETARFSLLRGAHTYFATLMPFQKQASGYSSIVKASKQDNLSVCGDGDTLFISLEDSNNIVARKNVDCNTK